MAYRLIVVDGGLACAGWMASGTCAPFLRRLEVLRELHQPLVLGVAWDAPRESTWRRARSAEYKAKRTDPDPNFHAALADLRAGLPGLDVLQFSAVGAEADDVLFSLSLTRPGPTLLVSGDKDLLQAVQLGVDLLRTASRWNGQDQLLTAENLPLTEIKIQGQKLSGLDAKGWGALLALAGDPTDGVPGLPGVGPRKAFDLLQACPDFVELLCRPCPECELADCPDKCDDTVRHQMFEDRLELARRQCNAASAIAARWVEKAIAHLPELRVSRELTALRMVEVEVFDDEEF